MSGNLIDFLDAARNLHARTIVIDAHCDTTQRLADPAFDLMQANASGHVDIPRLRQGGVAAIFFAVYAGKLEGPGDGIQAARSQMKRIHETVARYPDGLAGCTTASEVRSAFTQNRIAVLTAIEGGHLIEDSLEHLRELRAAGAVYLTLTHSFHTNWADSSGVHEPVEPLHGGLTPFGKDVIRELNRLGMMVDVSHASDRAVRDVLEVSPAPVIASHSSCRAVSPHRRNLPDDLIRDIASSGGTVQINFAAAFVDPDFPPVDSKMVNAWHDRKESLPPPFRDHVTPLDRLIDHVDHALHLVGPDHVGLGSDFDGTLALPRNLEDCSKLPWLTAGLMHRGYGEEDLRKVLGENVLRVMADCQRVAQVPNGTSARRIESC